MNKVGLSVLLAVNLLEQAEAVKIHGANSEKQSSVANLKSGDVVFS